MNIVSDAEKLCMSKVDTIVVSFQESLQDYSQALLSCLIIMN